MIKKSIQITVFLMGVLTPLFLQAAKYQEAPELQEAIQSKLQAFPGWASSEKADMIASLILEKEPKCYVEIGAFGGSSVYPAAKAMEYLVKNYNHEGSVYAIDAWDNTAAVEFYPAGNSHKAWWESINLQDIYVEFNLLLSRSKLFPYTKVIKGRSENVVDQVPGPIDILHIDGNPSEEATLRDIKAYLPKVSMGGLIIVSNCFWLFDGTYTKDVGLELLFDYCDFHSSCDEYNTLVFEKTNQY